MSDQSQTIPSQASEAIGLQRITPRQCDMRHGPELEERCPNIAFWSAKGFDGLPYAVCRDDMQAMANMNSDNAEAFQPALAEAKVARQG